jgi:8-oxo-dGTP diphosphatase
VREAEEELKIAAKFHDVTGDRPLFLSVTQTRGQNSHTDVTMWFVLAASRRQQFEPDADEFTAIHWLPLTAPTGPQISSTHTARFATKLTEALNAHTRPVT